MLFPHVFASLFTTDAALLDFTAHALRIYLAVMVLFGAQTACQLTFTALGKAKQSTLPPHGLWKDYRKRSV